MKEKLTRFALWLGIKEHVDTEREIQHKIDILMLDLASAATWVEYVEVRWPATKTRELSQ